MFSWPRANPLLLSVALVAAVLVTVGAQDSDQVDSVEESLAQRLSAIETFQARFKQVVVTQNGDTELSQSGRIVFDRRGDFRWEVTAPFSQYILVSEDAMRVYDPDLEQLTISSFDPSNSTTFASLLLTPTTEILQEYDIEMDRNQYTLSPKEGGNDFVRLNVIFDKHTLSSIEILDHFDAINLFEFSDVVTNEPIAREEFTLTVPEDTEVVDHRNPVSDSTNSSDE